ncbi:MAG: CcmD family protein [Chloroflexota bacterium]
MDLEYVFAAYAIILFAIFAYIFTFSRRQQKIERQIRQLRRLVQGDRDKAGLV